jgi:hypothetical protein
VARRQGITKLSRHGESPGRVSRELHVGIDCPELVDEDGLHGKQWSSPGLVRFIIDRFQGRRPTEEDLASTFSIGCQRALACHCQTVAPVSLRCRLLEGEPSLGGHLEMGDGRCHKQGVLRRIVKATPFLFNIYMDTPEVVACLVPVPRPLLSHILL